MNWKVFGSVLIPGLILVVILLLAIVFIVAPAMNGGGEGGSLFPFSAGGQRTDLRILFEPIILAHGNPENACILTGGVWHYEPDFVGCEATRFPTVDCSNPLYQAAMQQCAALGATEAKCDPNNAYCKYK